MCFCVLVYFCGFLKIRKVEGGVSGLEFSELSGVTSAERRTWKFSPVPFFLLSFYVLDILFPELRVFFFFFRYFFFLFFCGVICILQ